MTRERIARASTIAGLIVSALIALGYTGRAALAVTRTYDQVGKDSIRITAVEKDLGELKERVYHANGQLDEVLRRLPAPR